MKIQSKQTKSWVKQARAGLAGAVVAVLSLAVNAGTFPDDPLQTGAGLVPPNIMFILDNSGSMAEWKMPIYGQNPVSPVDISNWNKDKNSLGYDTATTYKPWDTVATDYSSALVSGGTSITSVWGNADLASGAQNIAGSEKAVFYVLRDASAPNALASFDRYRIDSTGTMKKSSSATTWQGLALQAVADMSAGAYQTYSFNVTNGNGPVSVALMGSTGAQGDADLYVTTDGTTAWTNNYQCSSAGATVTESCSLEIIGNATVNVTVRAYSNTSGVSIRADGATYGSESNATPGSRTNTEEVANFATWYSYHRTRMKTAKAGASRAFINLGPGYRVGFDSINDANGNPRTNIRYEIPTNSNRGKFEGVNKYDWYQALLNRTSGGGTPLRSALKRTGEYYGTATPWADGTGTDEQKCRASYGLLTTDGYWNSDANFSIGSSLDSNPSDDKDGDGYANTLADVAYYYYKNDLRPLLDNNVPKTATDNNSAQHMSLFGVSIGLRGTTPLSDTPPTTWPDPTDAEDADRIDDLWHAAVNAHGPKMIVASKSDEYANAVRSALNQIKDQRASGSNITSNGNSLNSGAQLFQAMFVSPAWSGDVFAYDLTRGGIATTPDWSMGQVANANATAFKSRPIMTTFNSTPAVFDAAHIPSAFVGRTGASAVTRDDNIAYIKGERQYELKNAGLLTTSAEKAKAVLRDRVSPIGDIVNSSPFYQRQVNTMFIAANDGMLHGVDALTGSVLMSYVPQGIDFTELSKLSDPFYSHHFFVDGQVDVSSTGQGNGKNILAASLGRGGKGIFALDVTSINTHDATTGAYTGTFTASNVLFDNTGNADADMGYVAQQPLVRMGNNNVPIVITGNGFESTNGKAFLYVYSTSGTQLAKIPTNASTGNGLSQVSVADLNNDDVIDVAYAGDMLGNIWKFNLSDANPSKWDVALKSGNGANAPSVPLFTATDGTTPQPVTGGIVVTRHPTTGKLFLSFGTGRFIYNSDIVSSAVQQTQSIYGLIDEGTVISGRADLQARTFPYVGTDSLGRPARGLEDYAALDTSKKGWYLNLGTNANTSSRGERVVTTPALDGSAVWVSSIIPLLGSSCESTGRGYVNVINIFTGTNPQSGGYFDVNGNGVGDDAISTSSGTSGGHVSSVDLGVAMPGAPAIVDNKVAVLGSNSNVAAVDALGGGLKSQRLTWREIVNLQ